MTTSAALDLSAFAPFKKYALEYEEQGLGTEESLRWLCRFRHENGLIANGALVELRSPGSKRPKLFFNRRRFPEWFGSQGRETAA
jgi:hypothetical protein